MRSDSREDVFTDLFDTHYSKVFAYVHRRLGPDATHDAVSDTFLQVWRRLDHISGDPLLWLYGIARGVVSNHRRGHRRVMLLQQRLDMLEPPAAVADPSETIGWQDPFVAAFAQLTVTEREALEIVTWEGLGPSEAAIVLGCSGTTFKVRLHRARRHLRSLLDSEDATKDAAVSAREADLPLAFGMSHRVGATRFEESTRKGNP